MKQTDTDLSEGTRGNVETVPWRAPGGLDAETLAAAITAMPEYDADAADIETYRRDGVVFLEGAFADWVETLRAGLDRNLANPEAYAFPCESTARNEPGRFFDSYCNWQRIPEYRDFVLYSYAASMAGQFMGSETAQIFHEHAFLKEPGTRRATPWHQDLPYYCVDGTQTVSIYIALDPTPEDVVVRFVAGSHRWGKLFQPRAFLDGAAYDCDESALEPAPDIDARPEDFDLVYRALAPGDAVLFDFRTLHGTTDATVKTRRRAFSTRWLGDDVRYCPRPGETSPPFPDIGLAAGARMREDWFPVLWRRGRKAP